MPQVVCGVRTKINQGWVREAYIKKIRIQKGIAREQFDPSPHPDPVGADSRKTFLGEVFFLSCSVKIEQVTIVFFSYSENFSAAPKFSFVVFPVIS